MGPGGRIHPRVARFILRLLSAPDDPVLLSQRAVTRSLGGGYHRRGGVQRVVEFPRIIAVVLKPGSLN